MGAALIAAALSGAIPPAPAAKAWINFRATMAGPVGFLGDDASDSYSLGEAYPSGRSILGLTFGWSVAVAQNEYTTFAAKAHQAGRAAATGTQAFRIEGLTPGMDYKLHMSQGAITTGVGLGYRLFRADNSTLYFPEVNSAGTVATGNFMDANGAVFASPDLWSVGETGVAFTALDTAILLRRATNSAYWNAIGIEVV